MRFQALFLKIRSSKPLRVFLGFGWILPIVWAIVNAVTNNGTGIVGGMVAVIFILFGYGFVCALFGKDPDRSPIPIALRWISAVVFFASASFYATPSAFSTLYVEIKSEQTTADGKVFFAVWPFHTVGTVDVDYEFIVISAPPPLTEGKSREFYQYL